MHQSQLQDSRTLTLVTKTTSAAHQTSIWLSESEGLAPSPVPPALGASEPILAHQGATGVASTGCTLTQDYYLSQIGAIVACWRNRTFVGVFLREL